MNARIDEAADSGGSASSGNGIVVAKPDVRIAILWPHWTGYMDAGLRGLQKARSTQALIVHEGRHFEAPLDVMRLPAAQQAEHASYEEGFDTLAARLETFQPNLILTCSWAHPHYRRLCRRWRGRAVRAMHMDNQWLGTSKQWAGVVVSPILVKPTTDYAFVPGERQARFARRLGFAPNRIIRPSLTGDATMFTPLAVRPLDERRKFLFVARVAPEKGVDVMVEAYKAYRLRTDDPWPLVVCGTGRLAHLLERVEGIEVRGFVQPTDLPAVFGESACMVLPSLFEPYAVALHEAALAGLGIICTDACGAGDDFVDRDDVNGRIVATGDAAALTEAMLEMSRRTPQELEAVRHRSVELAARITPEHWSASLLQALDRGLAD